VSLFDPPNEDKLSEVFPPGTTFMLYEVTYEGLRNTSFGSSHQATVKAGPADRTGDPVNFRVFGRLAEQTQEVENGELPALVVITKVGRSYAWAKPSQDDIPF
jgi:hypothetical protein